MIIDPACAAVFEAEPEERRIMKRPPRAPSARLLHRRLLLASLAQGAVAFTAVGALYAALLAYDRPQDEIRSLVLIALVAANVMLIFTHRTLHFSLRDLTDARNPRLFGGGALVAAVLTGVLRNPGARDVFGLALAPAHEFMLVAAGAIALGAVLVGVRRLFPAVGTSSAPS